MPLRGIKVVVVEDDQDHRELARILLTDLGAHVTVAANGEDGLKRLIVDGCPDLILCDLRDRNHSRHHRNRVTSAGFVLGSTGTSGRESTSGRLEEEQQ